MSNQENVLSLGTHFYVADCIQFYQTHCIIYLMLEFISYYIVLMNRGYVVSIPTKVICFGNSRA